MRPLLVGLVATTALAVACSSSDPSQPTSTSETASEQSTDGSSEFTVYHWTCVNPTGIATRCHVSARFPTLQACQDLLSRESETEVEAFYCNNRADLTVPPPSR
jgi:hypothetical protein